MAENKTMFIGVAQIQQDWGISRSKAYQIIKDLMETSKNYTKRKASPKRGKYACKSKRNYVSNLIIVLFCVFINQKHRRQYER